MRLSYQSPLHQKTFERLGQKPKTAREFDNLRSRNKSAISTFEPRKNSTRTPKFSKKYDNAEVSSSQYETQKKLSKGWTTLKVKEIDAKSDFHEPGSCFKISVPENPEHGKWAKRSPPPEPVPSEQEPPSKLKKWKRKNDPGLSDVTNSTDITHTNSKSVSVGKWRKKEERDKLWLIDPFEKQKGLPPPTIIPDASQKELLPKQIRKLVEPAPTQIGMMEQVGMMNYEMFKQSLVQCGHCGRRFEQQKIERHAKVCGEQARCLNRKSWNQF